jgi:uncharacterized spore protein YtfJ
MDVQKLVGRVGDAMATRTVFGEPYERDGLTVIPAAKVQGGGGGGEGRTPDGTREGNGGGFGLAARPVGAYVIRGDDVRWVPAFDLNRVVLGVQVVAVVAILGLRAMVKARAKARRRLRLR